MAAGGGGKTGIAQDERLDGAIRLSDADNRRICRKTDRAILAVLVWVYFLQVLDKSVLGYGATYGLGADTGLTGSQYSLVGSMAPVAQLAWQPLSSVLIVKVPPRVLMPALVLGWGVAQAAMAASRDFAGLAAARFFLGLFEAGCLPLFGVMTSQWYRRAEQPLRVAAWYSTNGAATVAAAALSYALAHIRSRALAEWQIIFLFVGLVTVASAPLVYWRLDDDIASARFLSPRDRRLAVERLRANQTGAAGRRELRWAHVAEAAVEPKTYLWMAMTLLLNVGASVANTFGPLIVAGLVADRSTASLLNMPFGALQLVAVLLASLLARRARLKGAVLAAVLLPVVTGLAVLLAVPRRRAARAPLLAGYYLLAFLFGGNPLIVAWIVGNTAGPPPKPGEPPPLLDLTDRENDEFIYIY